MSRADVTIPGEVRSTLLMSETRTDPGDDLSLGGDGELIARVRAGDGSAYGTLFSRHVRAARRLAVQLAGRSEADDLVSEAFTKVLLVLRRGEGPDLAFRAYLLTAVRRLHVDRLRVQQRLQTTEDLTPYDEGVPFTDTAVQEFEDEAAARAFHSLPERWQLVLWHVEVEGQRPGEVAPLLGMKANAVSALAYRAREGLRAAYLNMHTPDDLSDPECRWVHDRLGGYVRDSLSERDTRRVRDHLDVCVVCSKSYLELASVNSEMRALIGPVVLGGAAAAYLGGGKAAGGLGLGSVLGRTRDLVAAHAKTAAVLGVGSTVAAATITTALVRHDARPDPSADDLGANLVTTSRSVEPTLTTSPSKPADKASNVAATASASASASASPTDSPNSPSPSASPSARSSKPVSASPSGTPSAQASSTTGSTTGSSVPTADVGVTVGRSGRSGAVTNGRWLVAGVPLGKTVSLTVSAPAGVALSSPGCTGAGNHLSCPVGNGAGVFQAVNSSGAPRTVTVQVGPAPGFDDPDPANNSASVTAP